MCVLIGWKTFVVVMKSLPACTSSVRNSFNGCLLTKYYVCVANVHVIFVEVACQFGNFHRRTMQPQFRVVSAGSGFQHF